MLLPIPVLADYDISPAHGFLPSTLPLSRLPDPYYNKWEAIVANLPALVLSRRLRGVIDRLPVLSTVGLEHDAEWRRAYSLLSFMAHGYIWSDDIPASRLPPQISIPYLAISQHLEVPPVATYAAVCLWNYKPLFMDEDIDNMENLATLSTFTGGIDESWFYLISVAIEARGAPVMSLMLKAFAAVRRNDSATVIRCLQAFAEVLTDLSILLERINERCDPDIFFNRIRPFLAGSKNMADAGLPKGVLYDDGTPNAAYRQYAGGSNAQSSLLQFYDIALGIQHRPTGEKKGDASERRGRAPNHGFIQEMREYMPGPHAQFLEDVYHVANIREYVEEHTDDTELCLAYDACLAMLSAFRDKHIIIVTRYVITPSRRARSPRAARRGLNLAIASSKADQKDQKGTGGTALIPFLKQARDETGEPAVGEWTQRFLSREGKKAGRGDFFLGKTEDATLPETEDVEVKGLAGTWTMEDEVGGICLY